MLLCINHVLLITFIVLILHLRYDVFITKAGQFSILDIVPFLWPVHFQLKTAEIRQIRTSYHSTVITFKMELLDTGLVNLLVPAHAGKSETPITVAPEQQSLNLTHLR